MDLIITARLGATTGVAKLGQQTYRCALGRSGMILNKKEGDGATPLGRFALRRLFYRADRHDRPRTRLPIQVLEHHDGWCDDPADPAYNCLVRLPYAARHETMWRQDALYDLVLVIGHNDAPVRAGDGSAVFLHIARHDFGPTEGCVAFLAEDLAEIVTALGPDDHIQIDLQRD
ncbi:MAG TPA: L,D-transpeptidase family protein [Dongiaceae bacterium]